MISFARRPSRTAPKPKGAGMANLYDILRLRAPSDLGRPFAMLEDGRTFTYADIDDQSARYAGALTACGVNVGDRVAVQAPKCIEMLMLYLGCLRAGAVFLPLNTAYTAGEIDYFLRDSEPALFVCDAAAIDAAKAVAEGAGGIRVETLDETGTGSLSRLAAAQSGRFDTVDCPGDALAAILYTSGTTGRSKGAMLSHANLASNALTLAEYWRFTDQDVLLHALPIFHT